MCMDSRKMVLTNLFTGQRWRCRHREQTCRCSGEGKGWMDWESRMETYTFSSAQFSCSVMSDSAVPWIAARQTSLSITISWSSLKLMSIELLMPSCHLIFCCPCPCLQSFPASGSFQISYFFASGGPSIGSFSFSITPSSEYSGLISFRIVWLDLVEVHSTLKSLL